LPWERVDGDGRGNENSQVARLPISPSMVREPTVLEIDYQLLSGRTVAGGIWHATLQPPVLRGDFIQGPIRWQISLPPSWIALYADADVEQGWTRRGWLLAPRPAFRTLDLEKWFLGDAEASLAEENSSSAAVPSLLCWRTTVEPIQLYHAPVQAWLLVCSL